jgi:hypothetical protein
MKTARIKELKLYTLAAEKVAEIYALLKRFPYQILTLEIAQSN